MEIKQVKLDDKTIAELSQPAIDAINYDADVLYSDTENFRYGDKSIFADSELAEKDGLVVVQLNPKSGVQEIGLVHQKEAEDVTIEEPDDIPEEDENVSGVTDKETKKDETVIMPLPVVIAPPKIAPAPTPAPAAPEKTSFDYKKALKYLGMGLGAIAALLLLRKGAKSLVKALSKNKNTATRLSSFDVRRAATRQGVGFGNPNYDPTSVVKSAAKPAPKQLGYTPKEPPAVTPEDILKMPGKAKTTAPQEAATLRGKSRIALTDEYANLGDKAPKYNPGLDHDALVAEMKAKAAQKAKTAEMRKRVIDGYPKADQTQSSAFKEKSRLALADEYAKLGDKAPKYNPGLNHDALVEEMKANAAAKAKTAEMRQRVVDGYHQKADQAKAAIDRANKAQLKASNAERHAAGLEKQVTSLKTEVEAATKNIESLEAQLKAAQADSTTQKGIIEQLQDKLSIARQKHQELQKAYNKAYTENRRIQSKMFLQETNLRIAKQKKDALKLVQTTEEKVKEYLYHEEQITAIKESLKKVKRGSVEANNLRNALKQAEASASAAKREAKAAIKFVTAESETSTYVRESITDKRQALFARVFEKKTAQQTAAVIKTAKVNAPAPDAGKTSASYMYTGKPADFERPAFHLTGIAYEPAM